MPSMVHNIQRTHWTNRFRLVGHPKITDFTFKIDEQSKRSSYVYSSMNLAVDCGEKHGTCYADMMGGYSPERPMSIRVCGVDKDGITDFNNRFEVDWEDRKNKDIIKTVGNAYLIRVGLEREVSGKPHIERFLSPYDAIEYIKEHLSNDDVVTVTGNITYNEYQGVTRMRRTITGVYLSDVTDPSDFEASFVQTVLIDKDSTNLSDTDKDTGLMPVDGVVLDYVKEINGHEIRGQWPYHYKFDFKFDTDKPDVCKKIYDFCFRPKKKGYLKHVTFEGEFVSSGATVNATWDDVPDDVKQLVKLGLYKEEEAIAQCAANGPRTELAILIRPYIPRGGNAQIYDDTYSEEDIDVSWAYAEIGQQDVADDDIPFESGESAGDGNTGEDDDLPEWLKNM